VVLAEMEMAVLVDRVVEADRVLLVLVVLELLTKVMLEVMVVLDQTLAAVVEAQDKSVKMVGQMVQVLA
jgi:hypothetical protein